MASIVPQFDFASDALPTVQDLQRQARSLSITGLGLSDITGGVLGILVGEDSGATGALQLNEAPGMCWVTPQGQMYVMEQSGPVLLKSYEGGWHSRRYFCRTEVDNAFNDADGRPGMALTGAATAGPLEDFGRNQSETDPYLANSVRLLASSTSGLEDNEAGRYLGFLSSTGVSSHAAWCGRGGCQMTDHSFVNNNALCWTKVNELTRDITLCSTQGTSPFNTTQKFNYTDTLTQKAFLGWVAVNGDVSSVVSDAGGDHTFKVGHWGWAYGGGMMQCNEGAPTS